MLLTSWFADPHRAIRDLDLLGFGDSSGSAPHCGRAPGAEGRTIRRAYAVHHLGLNADVRLQDVLLLSQGDHEVVPELNELRENAARLGGRMQVFGTARDYFAVFSITV